MEKNGTGFASGFLFFFYFLFVCFGRSVLCLEWAVR